MFVNKMISECGASRHLWHSRIVLSSSTVVSQPRLFCFHSQWFRSVVLCICKTSALLSLPHHMVTIILRDKTRNEPYYENTYEFPMLKCTLSSLNTLQFPCSVSFLTHYIHNGTATFVSITPFTYWWYTNCMEKMIGDLELELLYIMRMGNSIHCESISKGNFSSTPAGWCCV